MLDSRAPAPITMGTPATRPTGLRPVGIATKETDMPSKPEVRIQELHLTLPPPPRPVAKYKPAVREGNLLYV